MIDDAVLRDKLAVDRTHLANERTLLAYIRTGLALLAAGAAMVEFLETPAARVLGVGLACLGVLTFPLGFWRFLRVRRQLVQNS
jgi:putative membrane protein